WHAAPWLPLWFCGALLIYNVDRLRRDPADALNVPQRESATQRLRGASALTAALAAAVLVALPVLRRDWITLALVLGGALVCLSYSIPLPGFRLKDVPVLKTFVAPTIVAAAIIVLPWIHEGAPADRAVFAIVAVRAWGLLLFNMILCDLRDVEGDRRTGIVSLPGALGAAGTRRLLVGLLIAIESLAFVIAARAPGAHATAWRTLCVLGPPYLGWLIAAVRVRRSERFYEWCVEGMFFLPALAVLAEFAFRWLELAH
ncbi:MAG TPA: UbiA family prenyltransferase, partial [Chthoniobacteraceae bacterium]|nr:UbiA family prenyltransferase [Chthoniobacteraceae bacterium]